MVGHLVGAVGRDVADGDAHLARGGEIDVIDADPVADDHAVGAGLSRRSRGR